MWMNFRKGLCPASFLEPQPPHFSCSFDEHWELFRGALRAPWGNTAWCPYLGRHAIHTRPSLFWTKQKYYRAWVFVLLEQNGSIWVQTVISLMKVKAIISTSLVVMQFKILCKNLGAERKMQWNWIRGYSENFERTQSKTQKIFSVHKIHDCF